MCFKKKNRKTDSRDVQAVCEYCEHAVLINDEENVLCGKKGIINRSSSCRKYVYDPLKRIPKPMPDIPRLSEDDII